MAVKINSVIDRRYPLEHTAEADSYVDKGHKKGGVATGFGLSNAFRRTPAATELGSLGFL